MNDLTIKEDEQLKVLGPDRSAQIKAVFDPMVKMLEGFEEAYTELMAEEQSKNKSFRAKRLRLQIAQVRIEAEKVRKKEKEEYLRAGNAIQGVYNILKFAVTDKEEKLKEVETYYERQEEERIAKLKEEREAQLSEYNFDASGVNVGDMKEDIWNNFLQGVRLNYEAVKEAERKAEEDRKKKEEEEKAERARIRLENERLKKEAAEKEKKRLARERKIRAERKKAREKEAAEKKAHEEALKKEREAREKAEAEAAAEKAAAEKKEAERKAKLEAEKKAKEDKAREEAAKPDREKLASLLQEIEKTIKGLSTKEAIGAVKKSKGIIEKFLKEGE